MEAELLLLEQIIQPQLMDLRGMEEMVRPRQFLDHPLHTLVAVVAVEEVTHQALAPGEQEVGALDLLHLHLLEPQALQT